MQELYHIHKKKNFDNLWKEGNIINFNENSNNEFSKISLNFSNKIQMNKMNVPFNNAYNFVKSNNNINKQIELLNVANTIINEYAILIRELGYENVRLKGFRNLPSRLKCIWLCRENQIQYWSKHLTGDIEVFKIQINRKCFKTRDKFIALPSDSYNEILKKAFKYWNYNDETEYEDDEYLYVGDLKVLKKL